MNLGIIFSPPKKYLGGSQVQLYNDLIPEIKKQNPSTTLFSRYGNKVIIDDMENGYSDKYIVYLNRDISFRSVVISECIKRSITHIYYPYHNEFIGVINGVTQVITIHDMSPYNFPFSIPVAFLKWIFKFKSDAKKADKIITVSHFSKSEIVKHLNISDNKISVVYNGVKPIIKLQRKSFKKIYLTYIASSSYRYKNILKLMASFNKIGDRIPLDLIVVAKPSIFTYYLYFRWKFMKEKRRIRILSNLSEDQISTLYNKTCIFVYPSLYEGFGLPILEAMQYDIPILASKCAPIPEVSRNACTYVDASLVNELSRGIINLYKKYKKYKIEEIINKYKEVLSEYSWEKTAIGIIAAIKN